MGGRGVFRALLHVHGIAGHSGSSKANSANAATRAARLATRLEDSPAARASDRRVPSATQAHRHRNPQWRRVHGGPRPRCRRCRHPAHRCPGRYGRSRTDQQGRRTTRLRLPDASPHGSRTAPVLAALPALTRRPARRGPHPRCHNCRDSCPAQSRRAIQHRKSFRHPQHSGHGRIRPPLHRTSMPPTNKPTSKHHQRSKPPIIWQSCL